MDALMTEPSLFDFYLGGSSPNGATAPTSSANTTQGHVSGGVMNHPSPSKDLNDPIVTSALDGDEDLLASHRADRIPIGVDPRSGSSCWSPGLGARARECTWWQGLRGRRCLGQTLG